MNYDENFWTDSRTPLFRVVLHLGCCKCSFIRGVVLCWALKQMCFSWDNSWLTWISESIFFCVDSLPRSIVFLVFEQHWSRASSRSGHISCFAWDFSLEKWWHNQFLVARILQCLKLLQKIQSRMAVMFYVIIFSFWCWLISKSWPFQTFHLEHPHLNISIIFTFVFSSASKARLNHPALMRELLAFIATKLWWKWFFFCCNKKFAENLEFLQGPTVRTLVMFFTKTFCCLESLNVCWMHFCTSTDLFASWTSWEKINSGGRLGRNHSWIRSFLYINFAPKWGKPKRLKINDSLMLKTSSPRSHTSSHQFTSLCPIFVAAWFEWSQS